MEGLRLSKKQEVNIIQLSRSVQKDGFLAFLLIKQAFS
jgi:hypothetical protein